MQKSEVFDHEHLKYIVQVAWIYADQIAAGQRTHASCKEEIRAAVERSVQRMPDRRSYSEGVAALMLAEIDAARPGPHQTTH
jgi:hypothetical protein